MRPNLERVPYVGSVHVQIFPCMQRDKSTCLSVNMNFSQQVPPENPRRSSYKYGQP